MSDEPTLADLQIIRDTMRACAAGAAELACLFNDALDLGAETDRLWVLALDVCSGFDRDGVALCSPPTEET